MSISPYYLLIGAGVAVFIVLLLRNLRLAFQLVLTLGKALLVALLIVAIGWALGLWRIPSPLAGFFLDMRRLWQPLQRSVMEWIRRALR